MGQDTLGILDVLDHMMQENCVEAFVIEASHRIPYEYLVPSLASEFCSLFIRLDTDARHSEGGQST